MDDQQAIYLAENSGMMDARDAWQHLVTSGRVWSLPAWFGRMAASMIAAGHITRPSYKGAR